MALMRVDFPEPFGPRIATCSPAAIDSVIRSSAIFSPRWTVTFRNSISGGIGLRQPRSRLEIEALTGQEVIIRLVGLVDGDLARPHHFEAIALYDQGGPFVDAD